MAGTLILVCGLPGAGKTTLARQLEQGRAGVRLSPDEWIDGLVADPLDVAERDRLRDPVENVQWDLAQRLLGLGATVVLENGFWGAEERDAYMMGAIELGAGVELHVLTAPFAELWRRVEARNRRLPNRLFEMSRSDLHQAWDAFQPPSEEELGWADVATLRISGVS